MKVRSDTMDKKTIRRNMLKIRNSFSKQQIQQKSAMMWEHLRQTNQYMQSDIVFTYVSTNTEAETLPFFEKVWQDGKKIAVPIIEEKRNMNFVYLNTKEELTELKWGIPEPNREKSTVVVPTEKSLFVVPALAVDSKGNRVGYGGGYYDTYFSKYNSGFKIGFIFYDQQMKKIEYLEKTDVALDAVVTEKGVLYQGGII